MTFYGALLKELQQAKSKIEHLVSQGQVKDFANYRFYTGQIKGLQSAIDICQTMFNTNMEE